MELMGKLWRGVKTVAWIVGMMILIQFVQLCAVELVGLR